MTSGMSFRHGVIESTSPTNFAATSFPRRSGVHDGHSSNQEGLLVVNFADSPLALEEILQNLLVGFRHDELQLRVEQRVLRVPFSLFLHFIQSSMRPAPVRNILIGLGIWSYKKNVINRTLMMVWEGIDERPKDGALGALGI